MLHREILRHPSFYATVLLTLALGIGSTTAVFSILNAVILRPFPYPAPEQLVRVKSFSPHTSGFNNDVSIPDFEDLTRGVRAFESTAQYVSFDNVISGDGPAQAVHMAFASPELFAMLGVKPHIGQFFTQGNNVRGGNVRVVVLGHALWLARFGGDRGILNRVIRLRGDSYTVIGVMEEGFRFPNRADVWVPLMARLAAYNDPRYWARDARSYSMLARMKTGVGTEAAESEVRAVSNELARRFPDSNRDIEARLIPLREAEAGHLRPYVLLLTGAVSLLLLIACVNVANLMLARGAARERELTIRAAIGAEWRHIAKQLLGESLVLSLAGGALGCGMAVASLQVLGKLLPAELIPYWLHFDLDWRVLGLSFLAAAVTGVLFGLAPVWQAKNLDLNDVLKEGAKGSSGGSPQARLMRRGLVVAEVAISVTLLVAAGLMIQSFLRLHEVDLGFDRRGLIDVYAQRFVPNLTAETRDQAYSQQYARVVAALRQLPGVQAVSAGGDIPVFRHPEERLVDQLHVRGEAATEASHQLSIQGADLAPGYFAAMGIPMVEGRDFQESDDRSKPFVAIISRRTAEKLFPGRSALGQQIRWGKNNSSNPWHTIIGVCGNTKWQATEQRPGYEMFYSYRQYAPFPIHFVLRADAKPETLYPRIRQVIGETIPDMAVISLQTMEENLAQALWQRRMWSYLLGVFAALALTLAAVGLFSVMSYMVTQRRRELGIRLALGSSRGAVQAIVLRDGLGLTLVGCVAGLVLAAVVAQSLAVFLLGINSWDLPTFAGITVLLVGVSLVAMAIPAWRATRIDPMIALRQE
jgi:putative ABC transport system permease protein